MKRKLLFLALSLVFITTLLCVVCSATDNDIIEYFRLHQGVSSDYYSIFEVPQDEDLAPDGALYQLFGCSNVINSDILFTGYMPGSDWPLYAAGYFNPAAGSVIEFGYTNLALFPVVIDDYVAPMFNLDDIYYNYGALILDYSQIDSGKFYVRLANTEQLARTVVFEYDYNRFNSRCDLNNITFNIAGDVKTVPAGVYSFRVTGAGHYMGATSAACLSGYKIIYPRFLLGGGWLDLTDETIVDRIEQAESKGYDNGYNAGLVASDSYQEGYNSAVADINSGDFGRNFLGNMFSAPFETLGRFKIASYRNIVTGATEYVTLGMVISAVVGIVLFWWFLKMFAGG